VEKLELGQTKHASVPYSELALHLRIAGKRCKIAKRTENWTIIELDGKEYEGLVSELIDIKDR